MIGIFIGEHAHFCDPFISVFFTKAKAKDQQEHPATCK
jgi:hypothetical protein